MLSEEGLAVMAGVLADVEALERDLVASSWATIACTSADASVFASWGAVRTVVANNGTVHKSRAHLHDCLPSPLSPELKYALIVGSTHLPNIDGFFELVMPAVSALRANRRIVVAGGMGDTIASRLAAAGAMNNYVRDRLILFGFIDELVLDGLIENAGALILPISYGGGSNLKTAEALLSGKLIVGTDVAFRGFERYRDNGGVRIANDADAFGLAIHASLEDSHDCAPELPLELTWESTLAGAVDLVRAAAMQ
jgi:glycosyltransferase involved in cell wall biosynthesis